MSDRPKLKIVQNDLLLDQRVAYLYGQLRKQKAGLTEISDANAALTQIVNNNSRAGVLLEREIVYLTTKVLAPGASEMGTVKLGKTFSLMALRNVTGPCRVRLYSNADFRAADIALARSVTTPPTAGTEHGVIADIVIDDVITRTVTGDTGFTVFSTASAIGGDNWFFGYGPGDFPSGTLLKFDFTPGHTIDDPTTITIRDSGGILIQTWGVVHNGDVIYATAPPGAAQVYAHPGPSLGSAGAPAATLYGGGTLTYTTTSPYPLDWVSSPEAIGSDLSLNPSGDVAYLIENLDDTSFVGDISAAITVDFEVLKEEK